MAPFSDNPHPGDGRSASALLSLLVKRGFSNQATTSRTLAMDRRSTELEHTGSSATIAPEDTISDASLAFEAIYAAFLAQRTMLRTFAELRGDDDAECLW
jgi:hypothetical protein